MLPPILFKLKRVAFALWLAFVVCMVASMFAKHAGWAFASKVTGIVLWVLAGLFAACVVVTVGAIIASVLGFSGSGRRDA